MWSKATCIEEPLLQNKSFSICEIEEFEHGIQWCNCLRGCHSIHHLRSESSRKKKNTGTVSFMSSDCPFNLNHQWVNWDIGVKEEPDYRDVLLALFRTLRISSLDAFRMLWMRARKLRGAAALDRLVGSSCFCWTFHCSNSWEGDIGSDYRTKIYSISPIIESWLRVMFYKTQTFILPRSARTKLAQKYSW